MFATKLTLSFAVGLFIYDALITLDRELVCFWTETKWSGAALIFFANKWISMAIFVMALVQLLPMIPNQVRVLYLRCHSQAEKVPEVRSPLFAGGPSRASLTHTSLCSCSAFQVVMLVLIAMQSVSWAGELTYLSQPVFDCPDVSRPVFSGLRAFVLSKSKLFAVLVLTLSLTPVGVNTVSNSWL